MSVLPLGMDLPSSVLVGCVVRALTGSPGLLLLESTGFVSTAFTDESPASAALLSPACAAAEELALSCALAPERSTPTAPSPDARAEAPAWLCAGGLCAGGLCADAAAIASVVATARNTAEMYRVVMAHDPPVAAQVLSFGRRASWAAGCMAQRILSKEAQPVNRQEPAGVRPG